MRRYFIFLLFGCGLAATTLAAEVADLEFNGVRLGQAPTADMICIRGHCVDAEHKNPRPITPTYKKASDITHFGNVEITSPRYSFFQDRLSRITFRLDCEPGRDALCIDAIVRELDERYQLKLLDQDEKIFNNSQAMKLRLFQARGGAIIKVAEIKSSGQWEKPLIDISDKNLMTGLRRFGNPDYVPRGLLHQVSGN